MAAMSNIADLLKNFTSFLVPPKVSASMNLLRVNQ